MRIVIVGNGVAGIEAALVVRAREPDWDVTIVSEESDHFFSRTALMYVLAGQLGHADIEPHERDLYARMGFRRVRARAVGVDAVERRVQLAGGLDPLPYDRLLLACGSRPRSSAWRGGELEGVGHFVTMQDLEWLERELYGGPGRSGRPPNADAHLAASDERSPYRARRASASSAKQPAVIGGGLIGIEVVEVMLAAKLRPRFFIREDSFWPIALDGAEAEWIAERLREHGALVHLGEDVVELEGEERIAHVRTARERYACDLCVVAIGVVPNTEWLEGSEIARREDGSVDVDASLRSSAEGVFAAGDCAAVRWYDGTKRPEQLWYTARDQGRAAGRAILGDAVSYERGVHYNSAKLMDVEYTTVGLVNVPGVESFSYEERGAVRSRTRIVTREGRVVGFNLLGRRWDHSVLIRFVEERRTLAWVIDHLREAAFDTELVPPLVIPKGAR
jgi:NADPH-dependent 2,4-dienoyl-CoA reductase/sulfur reductase-like enzyme